MRCVHSFRSIRALTLVQVVLATCHTAGSRQLFSQDFDVVIIDEATQAMEAVSQVSCIAII